MASSRPSTAAICLGGRRSISSCTYLRSLITCSDQRRYHPTRTPRAAQSALEEPKPKPLLPSARVITQLESAVLSQAARLIFRERHANPRIAELALHGGAALNLELEQGARRKTPPHVRDVTINHFVAGDVMEHAAGKREIESPTPQDAQRGAVRLG